MDSAHLKHPVLGEVDENQAWSFNRFFGPVEENNDDNAEEEQEVEEKPEEEQEEEEDSSRW